MNRLMVDAGQRWSVMNPECLAIVLGVGVKLCVVLPCSLSVFALILGGESKQNKTSYYFV